MADGAGWVPVALSVDVAAGSAAPALVAGAEVVLWRTASGRVAAWVDRCPHRGMRLSFGFVRGEEIACLYHGWQFAAGGRCTRIPAHPDLAPPETIATEAYAVVETNGVVWLWPDRDAPAVGEPPRLDGFTPLRSLTVLAPPAAVAAGLVAEGATVDGPTVVTATVGDWMVAAALQDRGEAGGPGSGPGGGATVLHLLVRGATVPDAAALGALAGWSEALRRRLEAVAVAA